MATLGRAFIFAVYSHRLKTDDSFDFILSETGWLVKLFRAPLECGPSGPEALGEDNDEYRILLTPAVREELASLHCEYGGYSDRAFQHRLSAIAESLSEAEKVRV